MRKFIDILAGNFGLKLFSLITAIVLWFIVMNLTNPTTEKSISVSLEIVGEDKVTENNLVLLNREKLKSTSVNLLIGGSASGLVQLQKSGKLRAYIDLTPIDILHSLDLGQEQPVRVKYDLDGVQGFKVLSINPEITNIVLDKYVSQTLPVTVKKIGTDEPGYITSEPVASPSEVTVKGPLSIVSTVKEIHAQVDVTDAIESFSDVSSKLTVLSLENKDITSKVDIDSQDVLISVEVGKYAKIPFVPPTITGEAAKGFRITEIEIWPQYVEVEGNSADIKALKQVTLNPVDVTGITANKVQSFDMNEYLVGTNLKLKEGADAVAYLTVHVEQLIKKRIPINSSQIEIRGLAEGTDVSVDPEELFVEVTGLSKDIQAFEKTDLLVYIDVKDIESGIHVLPVRIDLPEGLTQTSLPEVTALITLKSDVPEASAQPEDTTPIETTDD